MSIETKVRLKNRKIGDALCIDDFGEYQNRGQVAVISRKKANMNSLKEVIPFCRNRLNSITQVCEAVYLKSTLSGIDRVQIEMTSKKTIASSSKTSIESYLAKGISIPTKKVATNLISSASASVLSSFTAFVTSSLSSLISLSLNIAMAAYDLHKNGGSNHYKLYIYLFYAVQFVFYVLGALFTMLFWGSKYIALVITILVVFFFIAGQIGTLIIRKRDNRRNDRIKDMLGEKLYNSAKRAIKED